jgi:serine/threonine protein phosphatase PrpC
MNAYALTDVGRERSMNQDFFFYTLEPVGNLPNLFVVADGMGGHKAGDLASRYTIETLLELIRDSSFEDPVTIISHAIRTVNGKLLEKAAESPDYAGMGTTLVVATIDGQTLRVANVGDSRLYVISDDITQVTRDHSLVEEMVSIGEIDRQEARHHANKNIITKAIGGSKEVEPDVFAVDLFPGDKILLCTDGLTNMVEDARIRRVVRDTDNIEDACRILIDLANDAGGRDNITAMLVSV